MKKLILLCAIAATALAARSAKADDFTISFDGGSLGYSGSGVFVGTYDSSVGGWDITGVLSGSVTDPGFGASNIVGLSPYDGPDQVVYFPAAPYFDGDGLSFALANGVDINLYDTIVGNLYIDSALESNPNGDIPELATFNVTATPEPSSLALLGTGMLLGMGLLVSKRTIA